MPGDEADDLRGAGAERGAAEAALLPERLGNGGMIEGGIGGDDAGEAVLENEGDDFLDLGELEIGGDLEKDGAEAWGGAELAVAALDGAEELIEGRGILQSAKAGGIGRGDVEDEVIGEGEEFLEGEEVIGGGFLERSDFGFADIEADGDAGPAIGGLEAGEAGGDGFGAVVVKAHAVDEGLLGRETKNAGPGVAGLCRRR